MSIKDKLKAYKLPVEAVKVDGIDEPVYVRTLTAGQAIQVLVEVRADNLETLPLRLVAATACDADGNLIFGGIDEVKELHPKIVRTLNVVSMKLNSVSEDAVEEAAKN